MSVIQFPTKDNSGISRTRKKFKLLTVNDVKVKSCPALDKFVIVPEINIPKGGFYPIQTVNVLDSKEQEFKELEKNELSEENEWLESTQQIFEGEVNEDSDQVSWTAFHQNKARDSGSMIPTVNVPLPLIDYKSSAIELQYHLMQITVEYTNYINPGQIAVGCSDQHLYVLKKIIQMARPDLFGESYFAFMGGLHIEQAALICVGQLIKGTGMAEIIKVASLDTVGLETAVCDVNNIKKARYTLQVIAVVLRKKMQEAFREYKSSNCGDMTFDCWASDQTSVMFKYWHNVLHSIQLTLMLVRSFREANLDLLIVSLKLIVPLFFALDHVHYSRWVSVFIQELVTLPAIPNTVQRVSCWLLYSQLERECLFEDRFGSSSGT